MEITENLEIVRFTPQTLLFVWNQMRRFPQLFDDRFKDRYDIFVSRMVAPSTVVASYRPSKDQPATGILYFTELWPKGSAVFHLFFWDKQIVGREQAILDFWKWGFKTFDLHKIIIMLPQFTKYLRRLLRKRGVTMEGKFREDFLHNGKWYDVYVFSILKSEIDRLTLVESEDRQEKPIEQSTSEEEG